MYTENLNFENSQDYAQKPQQNVHEFGLCFTSTQRDERLNGKRKRRLPKSGGGGGGGHKKWNGGFFLFYKKFKTRRQKIK
jgi:hypothetical protein